MYTLCTDSTGPASHLGKNKSEITAELSQNDKMTKEKLKFNSKRRLESLILLSKQSNCSIPEFA